MTVKKSSTIVNRYVIFIEFKMMKNFLAVINLESSYNCILQIKIFLMF